MPRFANAQFQSFFDNGKALVVGLCIWVALYVCQGAHKDSEELGLSDLLLDAALCELEVVGKDQLNVYCWRFQHGANPNPFLLKGDGSRLGSGLTWTPLGQQREAHGVAIQVAQALNKASGIG